MSLLLRRRMLMARKKSNNLFDLQTVIDWNNWTYSGGGQFAIALNLTPNQQYTISCTKLANFSALYPTAGQFSFALVRKDDILTTERTQLYSFAIQPIGNLSYTFTADGREMLWIYQTGGDKENQEKITITLTECYVNFMLVEGAEVLPYEPF